MERKKILLHKLNQVQEKLRTFVVGTLQMINEKDNSLQALIMAPTHELARQIKSVLIILDDI